MDELPLLFASREWQDGPYQYQCIPALGGNAAFSAGLGVASGAASEGRPLVAGGKGKTEPRAFVAEEGRRRILRRARRRATPSDSRPSSRSARGARARISAARATRTARTSFAGFSRCRRTRPGSCTTSPFRGRPRREGAAAAMETARGGGRAYAAGDGAASPTSTTGAHRRGVGAPEPHGLRGALSRRPFAGLAGRTRERGAKGRRDSSGGRRGAAASA